MTEKVAIIDFDPMDDQPVIGNVVGECDGTVFGSNQEGYLVRVCPDPNTCQHCALSERCTESKAD